MPPLLTIVTITRNDEDGLKATLASASGLHARLDVEHIVVEGNDGGMRPVEPPTGVNVVSREPRGISDAFNTGITAARGEWIWFLNGGDTVHPEADIEFVVRALALTHADAVIFDVEREDGKNYRPTLPEIWPPIINWIPHPATFVRTELVRSAGGFSTEFRIAADMDLWYRIFSRGSKVDLINHRVAWFASGGLSSTQHGIVCQENLRILWVHRSRIAHHIIRLNLLVPYGILIASITALLGKPPRWLTLVSRRNR